MTQSVLQSGTSPIDPIVVHDFDPRPRLTLISDPNTEIDSTFLPPINPLRMITVEFLDLITVFFSLGTGRRPSSNIEPLEPRRFDLARFLATDAAVSPGGITSRDLLMSAAGTLRAVPPPVAPSTASWTLVAGE